MAAAEPTPSGLTPSFGPGHPLFAAIVANDVRAASQLLAEPPGGARLVASEGASRRGASGYFVPDFGYLYAGDTPLHLAAAGYRAEIVGLMLAKGAEVRARNRRGSEPLHSASVGLPGSPNWNPAAQVATIEGLLAAGADPNARNKDGATPLHRAVRTRCADAVDALLRGGADPRLETGRGSSAVRLAEVASGRGGSGSVEAREGQERIGELLRAALGGERRR